MTGFPNLVPGRVSLIVPCYNVDKYLEDFIASIVGQTYKKLEIILVNDGANEATTEGLRAAVPRLEAEGYRVLLIEQENKGLAGAVDAGLKHFTGELLMWPDPDDWLLPHSIERRVQIMRGNPDAGLLRTNCRLFIEARKEFDGYFMDPAGRPHWQPEFFDNLFLMRDYHAPVCHIARSEAFLSANPRRTLFYSSVSSQNFQMLVPLVESAPVLQVSEVLAVYRVREDSRSRAPNKSYNTLAKRLEQMIELIEHTMPTLKTYETHASDRILNFHLRNRFLPTTFRGAMLDSTKQALSRTNLAAWRKTLSIILVSLRANTAFIKVDGVTGKLLSRALARLFDRLIALPSVDSRWGRGPLWSVANLPAPVIPSQTPSSGDQEITR